MKNYTENLCLASLVCLLTLLLFSSCGKLSSEKGGNDEIKIKECKSIFEKARAAQGNEKYDEAISLYKRCIAYHSKDSAVNDSLQPVITNAMLQLLNSYQTKGDAIGCTAFFKHLYEHPSAMIRKYCMRDVYSYYAYALYRSDQMDESKIIINQALGMPLYNPSHENRFRDYSYAMAIYYCESTSLDTVLNMGRKALHESELCPHTSGVQWIYDLMATIYKNTGNIQKAIQLYRESIKVAAKKDDYLSLAYNYNVLALLYSSWDIPLYADRCANMAIYYSKKSNNKNPDICSAAYVKKAEAMQSLSHPDSAFYYLRMAQRCCHDTVYNNGQMNIDLANGSLLTERSDRPSIMRGITILQKVAKNAMTYNKSNAYHCMAQGYLKINNKAKAEEMLDSMYATLHSKSTPIYINGLYSQALAYYLTTNDARNIKRYSQALLDELQFDRKQRVASRLAELIVKIHAERDSLRIQNIKNKERETKQILYSSIGGLVIFSSLLIILFMYKRRLYKVNSLLMKTKLYDLLDKLEYEKKLCKETEDKLSLLLSDNKERSHIEATSAEMLVQKGEEEFRRRFNLLYPTFTKQLHDIAQNLSRKDELFCMLIALGQDSFQIELLLNIANRSVIMARYRIRQKMQLDSDSNLDDIIKEMLKQDCNTDPAQSEEHR